MGEREKKREEKNIHEAPENHATNETETERWWCAGRSRGGSRRWWCE